MYTKHSNILPYNNFKNQILVQKKIQKKNTRQRYNLKFNTKQIEHQTPMSELTNI